jgi:hypothetical protein
MQLDSSRNHIILVNLWISVASLSFAVRANGKPQRLLGVLVLYRVTSHGCCAFATANRPNTYPLDHPNRRWPCCPAPCTA